MADKHDWLDSIEDQIDDEHPAQQRTSDDHWVIDKRVPLALIVTLVTFFAGWSGTIIWWGAGINQRVVAVEQAVTSYASTFSVVPQLQQRMEAQERATQSTAQVIPELRERATRMETTLGFVQSGVDRIEHSLEGRFGSTAANQPAVRPRVTIAPTITSTSATTTSVPLPLSPPVRVQ